MYIKMLQYNITTFKAVLCYILLLKLTFRRRYKSAQLITCSERHISHSVFLKQTIKEVLTQY
jgi:inner membrane protein involved in colicin E2 resistance